MKGSDYASQSRVMIATAKCIEILGPLVADERDRALFGVIIYTLDDKEPRHKAIIEGLLAKMSTELKG